MTNEEIKAVLEKIIETVDILAEETAELVDKYHRRFELGADFYQEAAERANAVTISARNMRQAACILLGIPDRQAKPEPESASKVGTTA
jgi:L-rhamnose isomerase